MADNISNIFLASESNDSKSVGLLMKALAGNNLKGFDYLEYKSALKAMKNLNMDEATSFKSAFATASTLGLSKQKLMETAGYYVKVLEKEKGHFSQALSKQEASRINDRKSGIEKMKRAIQDKEAQMKALQVDIENLKQEINKSNGSLEGDKMKIESTKVNFEQAFNAIIAEIASDLQKIDTHL